MAVDLEKPPRIIVVHSVRLGSGKQMNCAAGGLELARMLFVPGGRRRRLPRVCGPEPNGGKKSRKATGIYTTFPPGSVLNADRGSDFGENRLAQFLLLSTRGCGQ